MSVLAVVSVGFNRKLDVGEAVLHFLELLVEVCLSCRSLGNLNDLLHERHDFFFE